MQQITKEILKNVYPKRPPVGRKYDYGLLTVIGGSEFYSGSPAFAALSAFKSGVDMVRIIAPKRAADIIASFAPDLATYPLKGAWLTKEHVATLLEMIEGAKAVSRGKTAVVIGGGMGRSEETQEAILEFLSQTFVPCVIDADAIHAVGKRPGVVSGKNFLITPHSYEFFVLTGKEVDELSEEDKIKLVQAEAQRLQTTILLKSGTDIISDGKEIALNKTGTCFMTVGGTGDSLAGIAGAILAKGMSAFEAGCAAAYINGLAGEIAAKRLGESLMTSDLIETIPEALK